MSPLEILLIVLVVVGTWAVAEIAVTLRKTRTTLNEANKAIDDLSHSVNELIDQAMPIVTKADGLIDELDPVVRDLPQLLESTNTVIDEGTVALKSLNGILGDVSSTTHGVAGVGESAGRIVSTATSAAVGVVSKVASLGGITIPEGQQLIGKGPKASPEPAAIEAPVAAEEPRSRKGGYVTYTPVSASSAVSADQE